MVAKLWSGHNGDRHVTGPLLYPIPVGSTLDGN